MKAFVSNNDLLDIQQMNTFTDDTANFLSTKLDLLRESPGGLKLNPQLTSFLTKLCFHHIRIWQNYAKLLFAKIMVNRSYFYIICCWNSACFLGNGMATFYLSWIRAILWQAFKLWFKPENKSNKSSFQSSLSIRYVQSADVTLLLFLYLFPSLISSMDIWLRRISQLISRFEI